MRTILVQPSPFERQFQRARKGDEFVVFLHGLGWPPELRQSPPRVRLLENSRGTLGFTLCEIVGEWPGAPAYWPQYKDPESTRPHWDVSGGAPVPER